MIQVRLSRLGSNGGATEDVPRFAESHDLEVSLDGDAVQVFTLAGEPLAPGTADRPRISKAGEMSTRTGRSACR